VGAIKWKRMMSIGYMNRGEEQKCVLNIRVKFWREETTRYQAVDVSALKWILNRM
jgi:hypothetical protein